VDLAMLVSRQTTKIDSITITSKTDSKIVFNLTPKQFKMPYYTEPNTITEDMLTQLINNDVEKNIETITTAIMNRYKKLEALGNDGEEDEVLDIMYADRKTIQETPKTVPTWNELGDVDQKKWIMKLIDAGLFKPRHGQGFHWLGQGYRNQDLWFWDKEKGIIPPCTDYDDYGGVPDHFLVGNGVDQFAPNHWENVVDHNSYVFLAPELLKEIQNTAKSVVTTHKYRENPYKVWHTSVMIKGRAYAVEIEMDDINDIDNVFIFDGGKLYKDD